MQLSSYSDYSLRMLMQLALAPRRRHTIREIAGAFNISHNHLTKIAQELGRQGYIETFRGRGGGLSLTRPPEQILIGEVVRRTEGNLALVECFDPAADQCVISEACRLKFALASALEAFFRVLDGYTLSDLLQDRGRLEAILGGPDGRGR
ncbi:MAG: RrF2 family transcriptional regulator [Pikeienuella sp.]